MTLNQVDVGSGGVIASVGGSGELRQHLLDMGVIPGSYVRVVKLAPMGDPIEITVRGYELSLRKADAESIEVE